MLHKHNSYGTRVLIFAVYGILPLCLHLIHLLYTFHLLALRSSKNLRIAWMEPWTDTLHREILTIFYSQKDHCCCSTHTAFLLLKLCEKHSNSSPLWFTFKDLSSLGRFFIAVQRLFTSPTIINKLVCYTFHEGYLQGKGTVRKTPALTKSTNMGI